MNLFQADGIVPPAFVLFDRIGSEMFLSNLRSLTFLYFRFGDIMLKIIFLYHLLMGLTTLYLICCCRPPYFKTKVCFYSGVGLFLALVYAVFVGDTGAFAYDLPNRPNGQCSIAPLFSNLRLFVQGVFIEGSLFLFGCSIQILFREKGSFVLRMKKCGLLFVLSMIVALIGIDSMLIEPFALKVKKVEIRSEKITKPLRIVFISDPQMDQVGKYEKRVFQTVKEQNADLLLLGGDYIQFSRSSVEKEVSLYYAFKGKRGKGRDLGGEFNALLQEIDLDASLGCFAIAGKKYECAWGNDLFHKTKIRMMPNTETMEIRDDLLLTFLDPIECWSDQRKDFLTSQQKRSGKYHLILGHCPDFATAFPDGDLLLAGHTHGGQIRLPFFGALFINTSKLPRRYGSGHSRLVDPESGRKIDLIVSNGTGMERGMAPRIRFFCPPDIWVIDLLPIRK